MILQRMVFNPSSDEVKSLYYKGNQSCVDEFMVIKAGDELDMRTYFNLFSAKKWRKYTGVESAYIEMKFCGEAELVIEQMSVSEGAMVKPEEKRREHFIKEACQSVSSKEIALRDINILGLRLIAITDLKIQTICWCTNQIIEKHDIHIGIGICTFKREEYVQRNIESLKKKIFDNQDSLAKGHVSVCISDNAATLDSEQIATEDIKVVVNKNMGGVGGFTRTMLEFMKDSAITHVLLMDDDVVIPIEAIERTYTFLSLLRTEYRGYILGGALMRLDQPNMQYESGAMWNDGDMIACNHDYDMSTLEACTQNESEYSSDYVGWWYSCIPMEFIRKEELPLPLFIHRDDIEYGLRAKSRFLSLNGICVWHEAFENKCPGVNEYYDVRNLAIINSIHEPEYTAKDFKKMLLKQVSSNVGKYRYRYVDLNLIGALDFMKGFQWFKNQDTLKIHKELGKYNYELQEKEVYEGYKELTMQDFSLYGKKTERKVSRLEKLIKMSTLNGHFLPGKGKKPKIAIPYPNIYDLYRYKEVIYVDGNGKTLATKKNELELLKAYIKLIKVCRIIDRRYNKVCKEYRDNYYQVTSMDYWKKYLEIE